MREVAQEQEVLQLVVTGLERLRHARLVTAQPVHRLRVRVHRLQRMDVAVADDAQRMLPGRQRDQPEPVALAAHVVGRAPAVGRRAARKPLRIAGPVVRIDMPAHAPPRRVGVVRVRLGQAELALEQAGAPAGVDDPARADLARFTVGVEAHTMRRIALPHVDAAHHRAVEQRRARVAHDLREVVLEAPAIDLPARRGKQHAHAELGAAVELLVAVAEEEAEAELADVLGLQVLAQAQHVGEVARADLDRRFAHLERAFAHGMALALDQRHAQRRIALPQLQGEREAGEAAAEDGDVGVVHCAHVRTPWVAAPRAARARTRRWGRRSPAAWRGYAGIRRARGQSTRPAARRAR